MRGHPVQRIEDAAIGTALGAVPVIACFLAGWWISIPLVPESRIFLFALAGLCSGVIVDLLFLRGWVRRAYFIKTWVWRLVFVFYSVGMFGFFMGVPVFNALLALPAGVFVGRWLARDGADCMRMRRTARRAAVFTTSTLGVVCLGSASVALFSPSTGSDLQGMPGLSFNVTPAMILGIILCGGVLLLALNWWVSVKSVEHAYEYFAVHDDFSSTEFSNPARRDGPPLPENPK